MLNWLRKNLSPDNPLRLLWHRGKGMAAAFLFRFPGRKLVIIGVTGTNGKTTTTHMVEHILRTAGKPTGMISTVQFNIKGKVKPNKTKKTTLSPFRTQAFLRKCVRQKVEYVAIESSSHALHQSRLWGVPFRVGVLTNITHEHLDYHRNMEKYKDAKKLLFRWVRKYTRKKSPMSAQVVGGGVMVLNTADQYYDDFRQLTGPTQIAYGFGQGNLQANHVTYSRFGSKFSMEFGGDNIGIELKIPGPYNVENALAAAGAALACKCSLDEIKRGLESFEGVPGRMERISSPKGFDVIVDFALTPDALTKLYSTIRETAPGRVIGIIGATGERDREKRPMLGKIVAEHTDLAIVTDEEPYSEDPMTIMAAVLFGAKQTNKKMDKDLFLIADRYKAIEYAIQQAKPGDTVVVTGMGNFTTRSLNKGPIPWDEREIVREIIARYAK